MRWEAPSFLPFYHFFTPSLPPVPSLYLALPLALPLSAPSLCLYHFRCLLLLASRVDLFDIASLLCGVVKLHRSRLQQLTASLQPPFRVRAAPQLELLYGNAGATFSACLALHLLHASIAPWVAARSARRAAATRQAGAAAAAASMDTVVVVPAAEKSSGEGHSQDQEAEAGEEDEGYVRLEVATQDRRAPDRDWPGRASPEIRPERRGRNLKPPRPSPAGASSTTTDLRRRESERDVPGDGKARAATAPLEEGGDLARGRSAAIQSGREARGTARRSRGQAERGEWHDGGGRGFGGGVDDVGGGGGGGGVGQGGGLVGRGNLSMLWEGDRGPEPPGGPESPAAWGPEEEARDPTGVPEPARRAQARSNGRRASAGGTRGGASRGEWSVPTQQTPAAARSGKMVAAAAILQRSASARSMTRRAPPDRWPSPGPPTPLSRGTGGGMFAPQEPAALPAGSARIGGRSRFSSVPLSAIANRRGEGSLAAASGQRADSASPRRTAGSSLYNSRRLYIERDDSVDSGGRRWLAGSGGSRRGGSERIGRPHAEADLVYPQ